MAIPDPPYALEPSRFPLPALAALAARTPLGGPREALLAVLLASRLANDACPGPEGWRLDAVVRTERAGAARQWLGSLAVPPLVRTAAARALDATARDDVAALAAALRGLVDAVSEHVDQGSRAELSALVTRITA